jgi:hypothetical protein
MLDVNNSQRFGPLSASATLTGSAVAGVSVRFAPAGEDWQITGYNVSANNTSIESQAFFSIGQPGGPGSIYNIDSTQSGSSGDSGTIPVTLNDGTAMFITWYNGKNGAIATATISGWKSVVARGFRATR